MKTLSHLLTKNKAWVAQMTAQDPSFFKRLSAQQRPEILWIGCSDSRVPANQIVDMLPGELFVHRNVANLMVHSDLNCLSVLQFAVEVLKIKHIIICGHYRCGGVMAALSEERLGMIENWIAHIVDIKRKHIKIIDSLSDERQKSDALCELNVIEQVANTCVTTVVKDAWRNGAELSVHGWVYDVADGLIKDLQFCVTSSDDVDNSYWSAIKNIGQLKERAGP